MTALYDPLTYENLMSGLIVQFEKQPLEHLTTTVNAQGPGIYALFYHGQFGAYAPISCSETPIYVGKAVPPGARKGAASININAPALRGRLSIHARNIDAVHNLALKDFQCRFLPLVPVWITLAERFLIDYYSAVWNVGLDGFGNNPQGAARRTEVSWWDTLHPGRPWADNLPRGKVKTPANARQRVLDFFEGRTSKQEDDASAVWPGPLPD